MPLPKKKIRRLLYCIALLLILPALIFQLAVHFLPFPITTYNSIPSSTWIQDRTNNTIAAFTRSDGQWSMPLTENQISPHLLSAIVAIEDSRFYNHSGVDWLSALGAAEQDLTSLTLHRGASTITMQLFHLQQPARRSLSNKLFQAIAATQIDERLTKKQILIKYLNLAPFGGNLVGAGAASWRYFHCPCINLSLGQAALLAGLPQSPNFLRPDRHPDRAKARRAHVLDRMLACNMITKAQHDQAAAEPVNAIELPLPQDNHDGLLPTLTILASAYPGQTLHTTIDPSIQHQAAIATAQCLTQLSPSHITAAAVVILDTPTAQCLASVSLTTNTKNSIDLTRRPRSSGSTLKPFIYAAAFDAGLATPGSILQDSPTAWADYQPQDYDHDFLGPLTAADALAQSRNLPALLLLSKVTIPRAADIMGAMGLLTLSKTPDRFGLSLAIGGANITPLELAEAYATLARSARHRPVTFLTNQTTTTTPSILRPEKCRDVLYCLSDSTRTARISPTAAALNPAWKTGTSSGHRDAWCAAVTPRRTVVVWLGNTDGSGASDLVGQEVAAPLALTILTASDPGGEGFQPPPNFDTTKIPPSTPPPSITLTMICPTNNQQIIRDPTLPPNEQRLSLRARETGTTTTHLWWFIDGSCIGQSDSTHPLLWPPTPGPHQATAIADDGRAAHTQFVVR